MCFELDNDDMESSKRRSIFISLIFILKCFTKPFIIRNFKNKPMKALTEKGSLTSVKKNCYPFSPKVGHFSRSLLCIINN